MTITEYRLDRDARRSWVATHLDRSTPPQPLPAPVIPARLLADGDPAPSGVAPLVTAAHRYGWMVVVTYARGMTPPYTSGGIERAGMARLVDSVAVRCWRFPAGRAVALWERSVDGSKWLPAGWVWTEPEFPRALGVSAVKDWIKGEG